MGHAKQHRDRRSHQRVDVGGHAVLSQRGDLIGHYDLRNISASGALVSGTRELRPGHLVHVLMDFAAGDEPMSMTAAVRRSRDETNSVGVAITFPTLSADQEDAIHDAVLRALLRKQNESTRLPLLVFEPRRRVREEIESEIRSFGLPVYCVDSLGEAVRELEDEEREYACLVVHSAVQDSASMDVVEFFSRSEDLKTVILPEPDRALPKRVERLSVLPQVSVPRVWSRDELRRAVRN